MNCRSHPSSPRRRVVAMTLLEIMVAVSLLSLIVLTLYNMFDRTQKALRGTRNQSDVAEAGRAGMDTLCRELQQMRLMSGDEWFPNLWVSNRFSGNSTSIYSTTSTSPLQNNVLMELFFHNFVPQASPTNWTGIGYRVADSSDPNSVPTNGVGTLWRLSGYAARANSALYTNYFYAASTNFQRVCDGVIHFSALPYINGTNVPYPPFGATFTNTLMPSHVEIELGIVPPSLLEQARAFPLPANQMSFLTNKGDKIQMFRQLVPIQTSPR